MKFESEPDKLDHYSLAKGYLDLGEAARSAALDADKRSLEDYFAPPSQGGEVEETTEKATDGAATGKQQRATNDSSVVGYGAATTLFILGAGLAQSGHPEAGAVMIGTSAIMAGAQTGGLLGARRRRRRQGAEERRQLESGMERDNARSLERSTEQELFALQERYGMELDRRMRENETFLNNVLEISAGDAGAISREDVARSIVDFGDSVRNRQLGERDQPRAIGPEAL